MSEPLLNAIIDLFLIVAKEDDVTKSERDVIEEFLIEQLNRNKANEYLDQFDAAAKKISQHGQNTDEETEITDICKRINQELTRKQKLVLIQQLAELILADGYISEQEDALVRKIGELLNVDSEEVNLIRKYVENNTEEELSFPEVLIINSNEKSEGSNSIHRDNLDGFLAVLYLEKSNFYFVNYSGNSELFLNGIPIKKNRTKAFSAGSNIRGHKTEPIYYSDIVGHFKKDIKSSKISFHAANISFKFPNGNLGIRNVNIGVDSGKMIGLMGASGAGKSTLLNVLNGTDSPSEGKVLINGIDIHNDKASIEGVIGFVPQDDLLIEDLSVYQNLYFAGKLCFGDLSKNELEKLVEKTLKSLGLIETRDLKVGSPLEKTISGGQRKRLNIGLELLRQPSVLFVDEPTSGLSSRDSENIMDLLKELTLKGKLVFVVIHQPSSDIFKMFDKLVILDVGGYQIFYGNPIEAVTYFKEIMLMISNDQGECFECGNVNPEQIFNIIETKIVDEFGRLTDERKITPIQWNEFFNERIQINVPATELTKPEKSLRIPSLLSQFRIFSTRDILSKLSNKQYLLINLLEAPLLAFLLAYIVRYFNTDDTLQHGYMFSKNVNIPAYIFMSIIVALFMGLTVSAEEIIRDRKILKREAFLNLSKGSYLTSKIIILFGISAIQTFTFVLVGNTILEINGMLLPYWAIFFATSCFANLLGLNISSAFNSAVTIYILIPILLIPQLILSGVVVQFDKLNPALSSGNKVPIVGELMTSRWAFEAAIVHQFKSNEFERQFYPYDKVMGEAEFKKVYYIPRLLSKLDFCRVNYHDEKMKQEVENGFLLLNNEIGKELSKIGKDKFTDADKLNLADFNESVYTSTKTFLEALNRFYTNRFNKASDRKDKMIMALIKDDEGRKSFELLRNQNQNERIVQLVKNEAETHRITEKDGKLIAKFYPIYLGADGPRSPLNFRTQFYVPEKPFLGYYFDVFTFNLSIIWAMIIILIVTLYYDVLRKFIEFSSAISFSKK